MTATEHAKLLNTLCTYDKAQSKKASYNRYALSHYMRGLTNVGKRVELGQPLRSAIITEFLGVLADKLLKAVALPLMTKAEARYGLQPRLPELPDEDDGELCV